MRHKIALAAVAALALLPAVLAHAAVRTEAGLAESKAGATETYRIQVPVEKPVATTEVRLLVPAGLAVSRFMPMPGWERTTVKDASGNITEVTWKGRLLDGEFERFVFQARNPATPGTIVFKVYQRYADGTVSNWDDSSTDAPASKVEIKQ